jgi:hypothetical protein
VHGLTRGAACARRARKNAGRRLAAATNDYDAELSADVARARRADDPAACHICAEEPSRKLPYVHATRHLRTLLNIVESSSCRATAHGTPTTRTDA